jgi:hypothetical protein
MARNTHDNDNLPILARHPRLLAPVQQRDCNRKQDTERNSENAQHDQSGELTAIIDRIKFLNWIEFALMKKRAVNDSQVEPTGRIAG